MDRLHRLLGLAQEVKCTVDLVQRHEPLIIAWRVGGFQREIIGFRAASGCGVRWVRRREGARVCLGEAFLSEEKVASWEPRTRWISTQRAQSTQREAPV